MSRTSTSPVPATTDRTQLSRAATLASPRHFELQSHGIPQPQPQEVRIRIQGCGLCGSNLPVWQGRDWFEYPLRPGAPGHEGWGIVDAVGDQVTSVDPGQRVACLSYHAFADYDLAEASNVVALPRQLDSQPFPAEPLACAINVFRRCNIQPGQHVAVIGVGFLGALLIQLAAGAGATVTAISRREFALQIAQQCGATEVIRLDEEALSQSQRAESFSTVIEATGTQAALDLATHLVAIRGRVVIAGYHQDGPRQVNLQQWNWKGIDAINAHERDPQVYVDGMQTAIEAMTSGKIQLDSLITHSFDLEQINEAFVTASTRPDGFFKAVVSSSGDEPAHEQAAAESRELARVRVTSTPPRPRLGFLGLGWIGLSRMRSLLETDLADVAAVADFSDEARQAAQQCVPDAKQASSLDQLLEMDLDGIVIATPSGGHAQQVQQALQRNVAVFCQKPLARTAAETQQTVAAAEATDCLLHIDFCYRHVNGMQQAKEMIQSGAIGNVFLTDLVFHNAYGPDKEWFYDRSRSGGGCLVDLGTHLIDLCHWMLTSNQASDIEQPSFSGVHGSLWRDGQRHRCHSGSGEQAAGETTTGAVNAVEDAALVQWQTDTGSDVRLACSWNLHAGTEAVIEARFYGTQGAIVLRNEQGSFYDLIVEHHTGTSSAPLAELDSNWGGRALRQWTRQLATANRFDPQIKQVLSVAQLIDEVYQR